MAPKIKSVQQFAPLPSTVIEMEARRIIRDRRTIIDHVDDIHKMMYSTAKYRQLLGAMFNDEAIEGNITANLYRATSMIQEKATAISRDHTVATAKWGTIHKALKAVMRRYQLSAKQRRAEPYVAPVEAISDETETEA